MIMKKTVMNNQAFAVLCINKELEDVPEPFSCQPTLTLEFSFEEFVSFCRHYLGDKDILSVPSRRLRELANEYERGNEKVVKELRIYYLREISYAIFKELYYAESVGKGATKILHKLDTEVALEYKDLLNCYNQVGTRAVQEILNYTRSRGYRIEGSISPVNVELYVYAVSVYHLSSMLAFNYSFSH